MRLLSIRGSFFRGFAGTETIPLDSSLVIFFGPSASGKTSIAEGLEWLFFGTTRRRLRSGVDEVEQRGALRNVLCPEPAHPFVEAKVRLRDKSVHTLRRTLHIAGPNESTVAYIDETKVPDFASLGLGDAEHFYPIIVQHNLQEFILSSGTTRRRFISRLLGLEPLLAFDRAVDAANDRFMNSLPQNIAPTYSEFQELSGKIIRWNILPDLRERWTAEQIVYPSDWNEVLEYCREALEMPGTSARNIQDHVTRCAQDARRTVFDTTPYAPRQSLPSLLPSYDQQIQAVQGAFIHLRDALANYAGAKAQIYDQLQFMLDPERIDFWRAGLRFLDVATIPDGQAVQCPFCEELTITRQKVMNLQGRLKQTETYTKTRNHLREIIQTCIDNLAELLNKTHLLVPSLLDGASKRRLSELLPHNLSDIERLAEKLEATDSSIQDLQKEIQSAKTALLNLLALADDPDQAEMVSAFTQDTPPRITELAGKLREKVCEHSEAFRRFSAILQPVLSSDERVRYFEFLGNLAASRHSIFVASEVLRIRGELRQARQAVRNYLNREDRDRIQQRGNEIAEWFRLLYGGDPDVIQFAGVDPRGTTMRLLANILGQTRHASTHFSQSQLNCLGLAMHIVAAIADECPFDFVLFDDPIQSFDNELRESFLGTTVSRLLDGHEKQIIVLTHLRNLADRLRYGNERRRPLYYEIQPFSSQGMQVKLTNRLKSESQDIRRRAREDPIERKVACQCLRTFVEHIIKAIYQAETQEAVPESYEHRTGRDLLILLESIPGFFRPDFDYLRESMMFGVPPSHDDPDWYPPDTQSIAQRMDRLEQIARDHRLRI